MSEFTQLELSTPIITPAKPEILWNKTWIDMLTITSPEVNRISLYAKLIPCRDLESGEKELKPDIKQEDVKIITIDNLWNIIGTNPKFGMAMELIFQSVNDYGIEQGILKDPYQSSSSSESSSSMDSSSSYISSCSSELIAFNYE